MSYILEALKKADAERERGAVPDLHAQPVPLAEAYEDPAPRGAKPWLWLAAGAAIALAGVLAWRFSGSEAPPGGAPVPSAAPALPTGPGASVTPPAATPAPAPAPLAQREAEPLPVPAPLPASSTLPRQPAAATAPRARVEPRAQAAAASAKPSSANTGSSSAPAKAAKSAPAPPAVARAPMLAELPEEFRRQVPAMTIGGSVYSQQPANRMVILNGQVFREGSVVTPGLLLEQIGPKSAVFSLGGQRFEMPF